jgi:hypothetical protein
MANTAKMSLDLLVEQLAFLQSGGYSQRLDGCTPRLLQDSPSCPNFRVASPERVACSDCALLRFVPARDRDEARPCQHIPLNRAQETLEMLFYWASHDEQKRKLRSWLLQQILIEDSRERIHAIEKKQMENRLEPQNAADNTDG